MKKGKVQLTAEQSERLGADIAAAAVDHLSDDDIIAFSAGVAPIERCEQIQLHIEKCSACNDELQAFLSETANWRTEEGEKRLLALQESVLSGPSSSVRNETITLWGQMGDLIRSLCIPNVFSRAPQAVYATSIQLPAYETEDGLFSVSFHEEEKGLLTLYLDSRRMNLEGRELSISLGPGQWRTTLRRVDSDQLSASVTIPLNELRLVKSPEFLIRLTETDIEDEIASEET